ncbi:MAG: acetate kinase, partial [Arenimonas sp.]
AALLPEDALLPDLIAHRIVHGGSRFAPALITDELIGELSILAPLAPLHQIAALALARAARARWPDAKHIAVFDTAWHATLANWSRRLPVPQALHDAGIMRYGFHGLAFQSAMRQLSEIDGTAVHQRVVIAHLGSGCSLCAVDQGRSIDTSMSMTPLDGLPMATRSGNLDPNVVLFMQRQLNMSHADIEKTLWRESGLFGVSGISGDMRYLLTASDKPSKLAVEQFVMRVAQGIASMATSLGGIDAIVFSGGIGTQSPIIRQRVVDLLAWTGLRLDQERNNTRAACLEADESRAKIWSIMVDEEFELSQAAIIFSE